MRFFSSTAICPPLAFVFDIDGVLLRGRHVLPAAKRTFNILDGNNPFRMKIPFILLTNGGGIGEHDRSKKLTSQLGWPISPSQCCQAHTILKKFANKYSEKSIMVLGGKLDEIRQVAKGYGFKNAFTTLDVLHWNSTVWPFYSLSDVEQKVVEPVNFPQNPISAVFVYHDPRNWALDIQVLCDLIQSGGIIGGPHQPIDEQKDPLELVFCNPDLLWKSEFNHSRLGQGAFIQAFQAVFKALTGKEYPYVQLGKPSKATFDFAAELLEAQVNKMYGNSDSPTQIYMIGDNPESDIAGANSAKWSSVLVKTGVYDSSQGLPTHLPTHTAEDVEHAVLWAVDREMGSIPIK